MNLAQFRREARKVMKKNPLARRNHHLVVGERVKLSDEGWKYLHSSPHAYFGLVFKPKRPGPLFGEEWKAARRGGRALGESLKAADFRRSQTEILGDVVEVRSNGYFIRWDGESRVAWVPDKYVVSADSTSRKWPGNHYEGVDPMAKKNGRARRNMAMEYDGIKFDTLDELLAYKQATGGSPFQAPKPHKGFPKFAGAIEEFKADFSKGYKKRASTAATREDKMAGKEAMELLGGKDAVCPGYRPRTKAARLSTNKLKRLGMSREAQASFVAEAQGMSPKQAMKLAVEKYGLKCAWRVQPAPVKNPKLGPSPTIGYPHYYRQPRNAGPYTPRTFPYGYGGRPATYKVAKENSRKRKKRQHFDAEKWWNDTHRAYDRLHDKIYKKYGKYNFTPRWGSMQGDVYEYDWEPGEARALRQQLDKLNDLLTELYRIDPERAEKAGLATDQFIAFKEVEEALPSEDAATEFARKAKKNSSSRRWSRYAIQAAHDFPGWAKEGPVEANWTSYPTYAYEQFARANGRLKAVPKHIERTPRSAAEGVYALGKGPKWPIGDLYHARLALVYAMAPSNWAVHKKVLAAVRREYPQYNWDKWWSQHMKTLRARGRKDRTLASRIEMAAANPAKLSALILKK